MIGAKPRRSWLDEAKALERAGRVDELLELYQEWAAQASSSDELYRVLLRAADVARHKRRDSVLAEYFLARAYRVDPSAPEALRALRLLYEETQEHAKLAQVLERLALRLDGPDCASVFLSAAEVFETRLARPDRALSNLWRAMQADPKRRDLYRRARQNLQARGRLAGALAMLEAERAALGPSGLADEFASLAHGMLDDPLLAPEVERAAQAALALYPEHAAAQSALKQLHAATETWRDRLRAFRVASAQERDSRTAARHQLSIAKLLARHDVGAEQRVREAIDRCLRLWPAMPAAVEFIEARTDIFQDAAQWLEQAAAGRVEPPTRADLLIRAARVRLNRHADPEGALTAWERAAAIDPSRLDALEAACELLLSGGRRAEAAALLERQLLATDDQSARLELHVRLVGTWRDIDPASATRHCEAALKIDPTYPRASALAVALALGAGKVPSRERLVLATMDPSPSSERLALCEACAAVAEAQGDWVLAQTAYSRALRLAPSRSDLLTTATVFARKVEAEVAWAEELQGIAHAVGPNKASDLSRQAARLFATAGRIADAVDCYSLLLRDVPTDREAQRFLGDQRAPVEAAPPSDGPAAASLASPSSSRQAGLLVEFATAQGRSEKKSIGLELVAQQEPRAALHTLLRVLALDPRDAAVLGRARQAAAALGALAEVARVMLAAAEEETDAATALELAREAADLAAEAGAGELQERALRVALDAAPTAGVLLERLARLLVAEGRVQEAEPVLRRALAACEGSRRAELCLELAHVEERLGNPRVAAKAIEEALRAGAPISEADRWVAFLDRVLPPGEVVSSLLGLAAELPAETGESLRRLAKARQEAFPTQSGDQVRQLAATLRARPSDAESRLRLEELLAGEPERLGAARVLVELATSPTDGRVRMAALQVVGEAAPDLRERVAALAQLAAMHAEQRHHELALGTLCRALRMSPAEHQLLKAARDAAVAADALDTWLEFLEELLVDSPTGVRSVLHREVAAVAELLGDRARAITELRESLALDDKEPAALQALARLHRGGEEWAALADILETLAEHSPDASVGAAALRELAVLREARLYDQDGAIASWRRLAELDPLHRESAAQLERLATELGRTEDLAFALELQRAQEGGSPRGLDLSVRLAILKEEKLEDARGALELVRRVLEKDSGHLLARQALEVWAESRSGAGRGALDLLDPLLVQAGDHERRAQLRELRLPAARGREQAALLDELAEICGQYLGQEERALLGGIKAFASSEERELLLPTLVRLAESCGSGDELAEVLESACETLLPGDPKIGELARHAARLRERLGQHEAAEKLWRQVLEAVPTDAEAREAVSHARQRTETARSLSVMYAQQLADAREPTERVGALLKVAEAKERAGDVEGALADVRAARALQPTPPVLSALERLLGRVKQPLDQAEVLAELAQLAELPSARATLLARRGRLLEKEGLGKAALEAYSASIAAKLEVEAVAGLERLLERDDVRAEAAGVLETVRRRRRDLRGLAEVLEIRAETTGAAQTAALWTEVGLIRESLGDARGAFAARAKAYGLRPEDQALRDDLETSAEASGSVSELGELYRELLEGELSEDLARALAQRLAHYYRERLGRPDLAARALEEATRSGGSREELTEYVEACRGLGEPRRLVDALCRLAQVEPEIERQIDALHEAAIIAEDQLSGDGIAASIYRSILERSPRDELALRSLERVLGMSRQHHEQASALERLVELAQAAEPSNEPPDALLRLVRLCHQRLGDPARAFSWAKRAMVEWPDSTACVDLLDELSRVAGPVGEDAARLLEERLETLGGQTRLVELLERRVATSTSAAERAASLRRIAALRSQAAGGELAFVALAGALREEPADEYSLARCLELGRAEGLLEELQALLQELSGRVELAPQARARLLRERGRLELELGDEDAAIASHEELLSVEPGDAEAVAALDRLYDDPKRRSSQAAFLERRLRLASTGAERARIERRLAAAREAMGDLGGAVEPLREAFALFEHGGLRIDASEVLTALERVLGGLGRHLERAEVLSRLAERAVPGDEVRLAVRRAEALIDAGRYEGALSAYSDVLKHWSGEASTVPGLERLVRQSGTAAEAARLLEPVLAAVGDRRRRAEVLEQLLERAEPRERDALRRELARLYEELGDGRRAVVHLRALFEARPDDRELGAELERIAGAYESLGELADALAGVLHQGKLLSNRFELLMRLGGIRLRQGRSNDAVGAYEEAAKVDAGSPLPLAALAGIHRASGTHEHLAKVLLRWAEREPAVDVQVDLLYEAAQLAEETLGDLQLASTAFREVLNRQPQDRVTLRALRRVLERAGRVEELASVLEREAELAAGANATDDRVEALVKLCQLWVDDAARGDAVLERLAKVLELRPAHPAAVDLLERLALGTGSVRQRAAGLVETCLQRPGDEARLLAVLEAHAVSEHSAAGRAGLYRKAAELAQGLGDPSRASVDWARALREAPDDQRCLENLVAVSGQLGAWDELVAALAEAREVTGDPLTRARLTRELARAQERSGERDEAIVSWRELYQRERSDSEAAERLEALLAAAGRHPETVELLHERLASGVVADRRAAWVRLAEEQEIVGDVAGAITSLREAYALRSAPSLLRGLERLLGIAGRHAERAEALGEHAALVDDPVHRAELMFERGAALERCERWVEAVETYALVLDHAVVGERAEEALARLGAVEESRLRAAQLLAEHFRARGELARLVEVLGVLADGLSVPERLGVLAERAKFLELLGRDHEAMRVSLAHWALVPTDADLRARAERLVEKTGAYTELVDAYRAGLEENAVPAELAASLWRRVAQLCEDRLGRPDLAADAWGELLARAKGDEEALSAQLRLARASGDNVRIAAALDAAVGVPGASVERVPLWVERAMLARELRQGEVAVEACRRALELAPDHPEAFALLVGLLEEQGAHRELAGLLDERLGRPSPDAGPDVLSLAVRRARLAFFRLADPYGAVATVREVLGRCAGFPEAVQFAQEAMRSELPGRAEAARLVEEISEAAVDHELLAEALEVRAAAEAGAERSRLLRRVAELYVGPLWEPGKAFTAASRALLEEPDDDVLRRQVQALADPAGQRERLLGLFVEAAERASTNEGRAGLWREVARLYETRGDSEQAASAWKGVLAEQPSDPQALEGLAQALEQTGRHAELLETRRLQLARATSAGQQIALLTRIGDLQERQLGDRSGALETFRKLSAVPGAEALALERLDQLCDKEGLSNELERVLARRIELAAAPDVTTLQLRLGDLKVGKLSKASEAIEIYAKALESSHAAEARVRLEEHVLAEPTSSTGVKALADEYRRSGQWDKLADLLVARARVLPRTGRKTVLLELADTLERLGRLREAVRALIDALSDDPVDEDLVGRVERLGLAAGAEQEVVEALEAAVSNAREGVDKARLCVRLGRLLEASVPERSLELLLAARVADSTCEPSVLPVLERLCERLERWSLLVEVLEAQVVRISNTEERAAIMRRLGQLAADRLEDPHRAVGYYEMALQGDPDNLGLLQAVAALYEGLGDHERLVLTLDRQRTADFGRREELTLRMLDVLSGPIGDCERAIAVCRAALEESPRSSALFAVLSRLLEQGRLHADRLALLERRVARTLDPEETARLHRDIAALLEGPLQRPAEALAHHRAVLDREPRDLATLRALAALCDQLGRRQEQLEVLQRLADCEEVEASAATRTRLAELLLGEPSRRAEAIEAAGRAFQQGPKSAEVLSRLEAVFKVGGSNELAARTTERRAQLLVEAGNQPAAVEALLQLAGASESVGDVDRVVTALERVLELERGSRRAFDGLVEVYERCGNWLGLLRTLVRFLDHLDEDEFFATMLRISEIRARHQGDPSGALDALLEAFGKRPFHPGLVDRLREVAAQAKDEARLAAGLKEVAARLPRTAQTASIYLALAQVLDRRLDDLHGAQAALAEVLAIDPSSGAALDALADAYARRGLHGERVKVMDRKRELAGDPAARRRISLEIARIQEIDLRDPASATRTLQGELAYEKVPELLEALAELHRRQQNGSELAAVLLELRDTVEGPQKLRLQLEVAQLQRLQGELDAAAASFERALEFDATNRQALVALEELYARAGRSGELLQTLERQAACARSSSERVELFLRMAGIREDQLDDSQRADASLEQVLELEPKNLEAIRALERIRRETRSFEPLVAILEHHARIGVSGLEQANLLAEAGEVLQRDLGDFGRAREAFSRALGADPRNRIALRGMAAQFEREGDWGRALELLARAAQASGPTPEAVGLYLRAGALYADTLGDLGKARAAYEQAQLIDPDSRAAVDGLLGLAARESDWPRVERLLIAQHERAQSPARKAETALAVAGHVREHRDDAAAHHRWLEAALAADPSCLEAARPLAEAAWREGSFARAAKLFEKIVAAHSAMDRAEQAADWHRLGIARKKAGNLGGAVAALGKAREFATGDAAVAIELASALVEARRSDEARQVLEELLERHRARLADADVALVSVQLAALLEADGQRAGAIGHLERVLELMPGHEEALRGMARLLEQGGEHRRAAECLQKLTLASSPAAIEACLALAALARKRLADPHLEADAYARALRGRPGDLGFMEAQARALVDSRQLGKAARLYETMLADPEVARDSARRVQLSLALARAAEELAEIDRAVAALESVLELDPRNREALVALDSALRKVGRFRDLEASYQRLAARLSEPASSGALAEVLRALGELRAGPLADLDGAVEPLSAVLKIRPEDVTVIERLASVAEKVKGREGVAIDACVRLVPYADELGPLARRLARLFSKQGKKDAAYTAARVATDLLGESYDTGQLLVAQLEPKERRTAPPQAVVSGRSWKTRLLHPMLRGPVGELMGVLGEHLAGHYLTSHGRFQLHPRKHRLDVAQDRSNPHLGELRYAARLLGLQSFEVFSPFLVAGSGVVRPDAEVGAVLVPVEPLGLRLGGRFFGLEEQTLARAMVAFPIALTRFELILSRLVDLEGLQLIIDAAVSLGVAGEPASRAVRKERKELERRLAPGARATAQTAARALASGAQPLRASAYVEAAEATALRAATLVCADLKAVRHLAETRGVSRLTKARALREVAEFSLGGDLVALREELGIRVPD